MAYDEGLAERIRGVLDSRSEPDAVAALESEPGVRRFDMGGRPMKGWLLVAPEATADDGDLERWVRRGEEFAATLPPK